VFLNVRGQPYADTRDYSLPGGNPIRKAHATACRRAGIRDFTPHDWRHHWASWCVMSGVDLVTLKRMGGWTTLAMVDRYAALDTEHMAAAIRKLA
jgi:integrase